MGGASTPSAFPLKAPKWWSSMAEWGTREDGVVVAPQGLSNMADKTPEVQTEHYYTGDDDWCAFCHASRQEVAAGNEDAECIALDSQQSYVTALAAHCGMKVA